MTKKDEALKLALEVLEECRRDPRLKYEHPYYDKTITAIREALAEQPAQQQEVDWEKLYRLEVKKKEALAAKYERDTGKKLTRIVPMAEQPVQQQKPVACVNGCKGFFKHSPPAPKPWVGLEEQDMPDGENLMYDDPRFIAGMVWANNKLREKNA